MKHLCSVAIVSIVLTISCNVNRHKREETKPILCIDLLGGFYKDTVSLICNKEPILSGAIAISETEYGFSRIRVEFFELNGKQYVQTQVRSKLETIPIIPLPKDSIIFIVGLSTFSREIVKDTFKVALKDGKFIGLSKIDFKRDTSINDIKLIPTRIEITQNHNRIIFH
jgi:hypothetical protein